MKVVLFCGGLGLRMGAHPSGLPKPLIAVKGRPIIYRIMDYYTHWGHRDFILCLGHKAESIRKYFEPRACPEVDSGQWKVTCVDTGEAAVIGDRLAAVAHLLRDEPLFLANYADGLTDFHLPTLIEHVEKSKAVMGLLAVIPHQSYHFVRLAADGDVLKVNTIRDAGLKINGGYFVVRPSFFEYLKPGEEIVEEPFQRLISERLLTSVAYDGFWGCVDNAKDLVELEAWFDSPGHKGLWLSANAAGCRQSAQ